MTQLTIKDIFGEPIHVGDVICISTGWSGDMRPCVVRGETSHSLLIWLRGNHKWNNALNVLEDVPTYLIKSHCSRNRPVIVVTPKLLERAEAVYTSYMELRT
jgi:hypothetical protein